MLCTGENYSTNDQCLKAVESVKRIANSSPISEQVIEGNQCIVYTPSEIGNQNKTAKGKWKIEKTLEGKFVAKLFASNGQLMLATEEVVNKKNAENSIESVKKNSLEGNFIIEKDKFNKFYYKLRNAQKTVICVGETYEKLDSCISAIESVRYFAINSSLVSEKDAK